MHTHTDTHTHAHTHTHKQIHPKTHKHTNLPPFSQMREELTAMHSTQTVPQLLEVLYRLHGKFTVTRGAGKGSYARQKAITRIATTKDS